MASYIDIPRSTARGVLRLIFVIIFGVIALPIFCLLVVLASLFGRAARYRTIMVLSTGWCCTMAFLIGIRLKVEGKRDPKARLFVGNHVSYLDIVTAGAAIGGVFVSRHDIRDWPGIGLFARLAGTIFLDRSSLRSAIESSRRMIDHAREGTRITLFPEGTTSEGEKVAQFKPFLFGAVGGSDIYVQPFTILYTRIGDRLLSRSTRDLVYWYHPDSPFVAHAWGVLTLPSITAVLTFHETVSPPESTDKVVLRQYAELVRDRVAIGVGELPE